jgi:hypothetical protein
MLEDVALNTMYFIVIEPILMFFYKSHQKSDGILRGSLVKYVKQTNYYIKDLAIRATITITIL